MKFFRRCSATTRATAEGIAVPAGAVDVREMYPQPLTQRQRWILGLGAMMVDPDEGSCARLHPSAFVHPGQTPGTYRSQLKALWNIDDTADLLASLSWLLRAGNRFELAAVLGHPPLAWDLCRIAVLPRRAFAAGIIDEPTAWELMEAAVEPCYRGYHSWGGYVRDALDGRNACAGRRHDRMDRHVVRWWSPSMSAESPWQSVAWEAGREQHEFVPSSRRPAAHAGSLR
jgi:Protein of unknown function (DUF1266)